MVCAEFKRTGKKFCDFCINREKVLQKSPPISRLSAISLFLPAIFLQKLNIKKFAFFASFFNVLGFAYLKSF